MFHGFRRFDRHKPEKKEKIVFFLLTGEEGGGRRESLALKYSCERTTHAHAGGRKHGASVKPRMSSWSDLLDKQFLLFFTFCFFFLVTFRFPVDVDFEVNWGLSIWPSPIELAPNRKEVPPGTVFLWCCRLTHGRFSYFLLLLSSRKKRGENRTPKTWRNRPFVVWPNGNKRRGETLNLLESGLPTCLSMRPLLSSVRKEKKNAASSRFFLFSSIDFIRLPKQTEIAFVCVFVLVFVCPDTQSVFTRRSGPFFPSPSLYT